MCLKCRCYPESETGGPFIVPHAGRLAHLHQVVLPATVNAS